MKMKWMPVVLLLLLAGCDGRIEEWEPEYTPFIPPEDRARMACEGCGEVGLTAKKFLDTDNLYLKCEACGGSQAKAMRPADYKEGEDEKK